MNLSELGKSYGEKVGGGKWAETETETQLYLSFIRLFWVTQDLQTEVR